MRYFLSLGSNLGRRRNNIARALGELRKVGVKVLRSSSLYRTQPVGFAAQPWFYNCAVEVSAGMEPAELLTRLKKIEKDLGRRPARRNRPRKIDIDILMAGDRLVESGDLTIPHPRLAERRFVLVPLREIAARAVHPRLGKTVSVLLETTADKSRVVRLPAKRDARLPAGSGRKP
jgi:2-amino-4-hydroxy-6-hydroxymethyldihydropteridine diphosphokinase